MIHSDEQMLVNLELIEGQYRAIAELRRRIAPLNYTNFLIMAEGSIEQIRRLRQEIDEYLGIQIPGARQDEPSATVAAD